MLPYPDAWIEIAIANPRGGDGNTGPKGAKHFSAFQLQEAAEYAMKRNSRGNNVYVGMALRQGETGPSGRATKKNVITAARAWADFDKAGDAANIQTFLYQRGLQAAELVVTGTVPHRRLQVFFRLTGNVTPDQLEAVNEAMKTSLGGTGDGVQNADRVMRLAGTVSWPPPRKVERGYVPEVTKLIVNADPRAFHPDELIELLTSKPEPYLAHAKKGGTGNGTGTGADTGAGSAGAADGTRKRGRTDAEISALLERTRTAGSWHIPMLKAIASMIGRGWPNNLIRLLCAPYCEGKINDPDLDDMLDRARVKWRKPDEEALEPNADPDADVKRLNTEYAVLPIGGKTRVVKFGELDEFPDRVTIVMTQTIQDFVQLNNKYRHFYVDKEGKVAGVPMGSYWVKSWKRRQYDGGMAFMPGHDGDFGNRLNLWRGFGVKAIKPDGASGAAGCRKFLDFMRDIICNGDEEHFDYLIKREATVIQRRIRSEVALGLQTKEEGCGKGFYERTMGHLLGGHAMQINNADHIIGKFNPHLETLLRLTADEALFVGDPRHRNALFGLITEPTLTIEPKGCGVYTAASYLNVTMLSNSEHFIPVSDTARRFFIPTVSAARRGDHEYFAGLQEELDNGGYEALLYHLLHEVDLTGFNVRKVPQTEGLRQQRDQSLPPLDAWWCELLETGTLRGSDPAEPHRAISNSYTRVVEIKVKSRHGDTYPQSRTFNQPGIFDQARQIEPRLKSYTNDRSLGLFLSKMGCDNTRKVLRRQGWSFPPSGIAGLNGRNVIPDGNGGTRRSRNGSPRTSWTSTRSTRADRRSRPNCSTSFGGQPISGSGNPLILKLCSIVLFVQLKII